MDDRITEAALRGAEALAATHETVPWLDLLWDQRMYYIQQAQVVIDAAEESLVADLKWDVEKTARDWNDLRLALQPFADLWDNDPVWCQENLTSGRNIATAIGTLRFADIHRAHELVGESKVTDE